VAFKNGTLAEQSDLLRAVNEIDAGNSTNLSGGLEVGFELLENVNSATRKIFLFSDGVANAGITSVSGVCDLVKSMYLRGVGTSSFGIGSDFDEKMMKGISENGNGTYFFIDTSENIPSLVDKAFKGLNRTVASQVVLKVKGHKGIPVKKLNGNEDLLRGLQLPDLRESDLKQILVQIEIEPDADVSDTLELLSFELSYKPLADNFGDSQTGSLDVKVTKNYDDFFVLSDEVLVYLKINECSEIDKKVVKAIEQNDFAEAYYLKKKVLDILTEIVDKDELGFAKVLLMKAKSRVKDIEDMLYRRSYKSKEMIKKEVFCDAMDEQDEDMGYGLFD